jgi:hypothetical protein
MARQQIPAERFRAPPLPFRIICRICSPKALEKSDFNFIVNGEFFRGEETLDDAIA